MRRMHLEIIRMALNTLVSIALLGASIELNSDYLMIIAMLTWCSKFIAMMERSVTWRATRKKPSYKSQYRGNIPYTLHHIPEDKDNK